MRGLDAWVTSAVDDKDVTKVLVLASSLRRSKTTKKLVVLVSSSLKVDNRSLLRKAFDQVLCLDDYSVNGWIGMKDYAKLFCFNLTLFRRCVYLDTDTLVLKNVDELFDLTEDFNAVVSTKNGTLSVDTSVFCFVPSVNVFENLIASGKKHKEHVGHSDTYMNNWLLNQKNFGKLDDRYNFQLSSEMVSTRDFSIVKIPNEISIALLSSRVLQHDGIMESGIAKYWKHLYENDVEKASPKTELEASTTSNSASFVAESNELLDSIAIVGISCRHAGANNLNEFWDLLMNGNSGIHTVPMDRWTKEHGCKPPAEYESSKGGFLSIPIDQFDSKFFGISPKEMEFMDPQQRLLLEVSWEALENAGIDPLALRRSHTGIFVGAWMNDYKDLLANSDSDEFYRMYMGNSFGATAARLSFVLGTTGPSVATESGCSSAMQSVDLACKSLRNRETSLSLACGVNLLLRPFNKDTMSFVISSDGHCKTFCENADGFGRAEGVGVLVLKRYADAVKDGDHVWALIRGSSCVQEGVSRSMGTPTKECEALAMSLALKDACVHPKEISFIEAHGTGTPLGDPLEISAIAEVYGDTDRNEPLVIGSVKTNIGHTESCSGITGIIKVVASLQNELIPSHLNLKKLNPKINLDAIPARIPMEPIPWPKNKNKPRLAGVSSFGITGTDGHLIIQETPELASMKASFSSKYFDVKERPIHILKLSAKTEEALDTMIANYQNYLEEAENCSFPNICFTANTGRASFSHRAVLVASDRQEACEILKAKKYSRNEAPDGSRGKICFIFTGQGAQYAGMAKQLYDHNPVFRMNFDKCHFILEKQFGLDMKAAVWGSNSSFELSRSLYSQTAIFCIEFCLLKLWTSWGIQPDCVVGHSLGEFCAAVAANIISLEDALTLVAERSRLVDSLPNGKMLVLKADKNTVDKAIKEYTILVPSFWLDVAAINSTEQIVLAGLPDNIESFAEFCTFKKSIKTLILDANSAFHSRLMDPILEKYGKVVESIRQTKKASSCKYISGVYGKVMDETDNMLLSPKYWIDHTRAKVNFVDACKAATTEGCRYFLEIGPQPVLSALVISNNSTEGGSMTCMPSMRKNEDNFKTILNSLGKLYLNGWSINWKGFDHYHTRTKIHSLPTYPFQRKKHWFDTQNMKGHGTSFLSSTLHPILGSAVPNASGAKLFQSMIDIRRRVEYIKDHCVGQRVIFPGAGFLEMCLSAGHCVTEGLTDTFCKPSGPLTIENLKILAPLALDEKILCPMQVVFHNSTIQEVMDESHDGIKIQVFRQHVMDGEVPKWTEHCVSYFTPAPVDFDESSFRKNYNFNDIKKQCGTELGVVDIYEKLSEVGLKFGTTFQSLTNIWKGENGILAEVKVPAGEADYIVHPVLLDAMLQASMVVQSKGQINSLHVPIGIKKFTWLQNEDANGNANCEDGKYYIYSCTNQPSNKEENGDNTSEMISILFSPNEETGNKIIAFMIGMEFAETTVQAIESHLDSQKTELPSLFNEVWKPHLGPNQARVSIWDIFREEMVSDEVLPLFADSNKPFDMVREARLERLCYGYILSAFHEFGWDPCVGESFLVDKFLFDYQISLQHKKLVRYFMTLLVEAGILTFIGEAELKVIKLPPPATEIQKLIRKTNNELETYENIWNSMQIYNSCGANFAQILQGKSSALTILFPQDPTKPSAESFYTESYSYSGMDIHAINNLKKLFKPYDTSSKNILRILEVGAGTGNFTTSILSMFKNHGILIEYWFTDISPAFFVNASKKFEEYKDCIKYQVLNVETDAKLQGFSPGYFDLIVGADVFHATKSLLDSISNVRQLLRQGGILCLIEGARQNHITCIFGLLEGYWRFVDSDIRQHHPLVSGETWKTLCQNAGFDKVVAIPCCMNYYTFVLASSSNVELKMTKLSPMFSQGGKWLVFPTLDEESKQLVNKLSLHRRVVTVWRAVTYQESEDGTRFGINVNHKEHMTKVMQAVAAQPGHIEGILYLWGLAVGTNTNQAEIAQPILNLCQAIVDVKQQQVPKLCMVTSGIYSIGDHVCDNPSGSTIWGVGKSCANELNMKIKIIDISPSSNRQSPQDALEHAENIFYELWSDTADQLIAYREKTRYFGKLMKTKLTESTLKLPQSDRFQLLLPQTKLIADLKFGTLGKFSLKPDEIEVQIKSCGLNFRDLLTVLRPDSQFEALKVIGMDFAGVVSSIGSQVVKWQIGDSVFGCNFREGALPSHVRIMEDGVVRKPNSWTYAEACGLPAVFATTYYSLVMIAKMKAGDVVLVHTASGGVGLAAIQVCNFIGAKVIATAGSARKRAYLKSIGVKYVFHSRNTKFEHDIMKVTSGKGVDIVLNSLTGPGFKEASLNVCKSNARFVEMSKLSIWQPEEVKLIRPDVDYTIVDLTTVSKRVWKTLFEKLDDFMDRGVINPIPYVRFDSVNIREALTYLQKAKHIGKVVCIMPEIQFLSGQYNHRTPMFNSQSTYLITGGLGGIGLEVCKWMIDQGATNLVLVNRSQPKEKQLQVISGLRSKNKNIITKSVDIGDPTMCKYLMDYLKDPASNLPPLRGIMHCAGVLSDATLVNQSWEKFLQAFRPKVKGAWNLHEMSKDCRMEHFVMFSSMAALFGPPGQSNHAAANGYLDALACYRDSVGLPAMTVNWGQWAQVGVAAGREVRGVFAFSPIRGIASLEAAMRAQKLQMCVIDLDNQMLMKVFPQSKAYLQYVAGNSSSADNSIALSVKSEKFWEEIDSAKEDDKPAVIKHYIKVLLRQILKLDDEEPIDDNTNFQDMGLDSLMMIELKNNLQTVLGSRMTFNATALADFNNIVLLTDKIIQQMNELFDAENIQTTKTQLGKDEMWALIEEDSILPEDIKFTVPPSKLSTAKVFFLTGVTGNLGPHILKEMLKNKQVEKVYCLMRKAANPHQRLTQILKDFHLDTSNDTIDIKPVIGDIVSPKFGLSDEEWDCLCQEVDAVIHCAVKVNHVETYGKNAMRATNVFGTAHILEFCANRKTKHLLHSSTLVAIGSTDNGYLSEDWPMADELKGVTDLGYPLSKMVGDKLVHQAVLRGLPAKGFRFAGLVGSSDSGQFKHHNNHIMLRLLCYMKLGAMPSIPTPAVLLPIDVAAATALRLFLDENNTTPDMYNICHPNPALEQEFPILAEEFGFEVDLVEYNEFVNRLSSEGEESLLYPFRELYENEDRYNSIVSFPEAIRKWLEYPNKFFSVRKISKVIPNYTQSLESTWDCVRRDLMFAKATGLFEKLRLKSK